MVTGHVVALSAVSHRADKDRLPRPIVVARITLRRLLASVPYKRHEVEDARREVTDDPAVLMGDVAGHCQSLEVDLRSHDGRAEIEQDAALQLCHRLREDQEVLVTRRPQSGAVA